MNIYTTDKIRNVVLLGHGGCGKTSLVEAMAYVSGLTTRIGKVTDGNTISDYDKEEIKRKFSITTSVVPLIWQDCKINLLDAPGYFDFVVPPLEGFWWQEGVEGVDYSDKSAFHWISVIRLPEFVTKTEFDWAVAEAARKKKLDCSAAEFLTIDEGQCVQIMHVGPFDDEPASVALMDEYLRANGYENDFSDTRLHHEIYLSDARKVAPEKWKTVIRHPVRKAE